ncbi:MAG TPA: acyl-CoA reductase [Chryseosolibacter sp.]
MKLKDRIAAFAKLGKELDAIDRDTWLTLITKAKNENSWFTEESIQYAFSGVKRYLEENSLTKWTAAYELTDVKPKVVGVVMAGNLPLVGFHDFLAVLISGNALLVKLSSKDRVLPLFIAEKLVAIEPRFAGLIRFEDQLKNFDAVIATGGDNSARYFHYYFGKYPNVIRKNRTSCAVLKGNETGAELEALGHDVFQYFGLGCRNVSKIFIPRNFDVTSIFPPWEKFKDIIHHHKYNNNYDYQKSIMLVNGNKFLDNGFLLVEENQKLVSPIAVLYYERYEDESDLALKLTEAKDKIQCIVGTMTPASIPFGQAQSPMLWDYADQIDTLKFLKTLN